MHLYAEGAMTLKEKLMCDVYSQYAEHDRTMAPWAEVIRKYKTAMAIRASADARLKARLEALHRKYERDAKREEKQRKKAAGTSDDTDDFDAD